MADVPLIFTKFAIVHKSEKTIYFHQGRDAQFYRYMDGLRVHQQEGLTLELRTDRRTL